MMDEAALSEWVTYQPPKSVCFGHQTQVRNVRTAWQLTTKFLDECTVKTPLGSISLDVWKTPSHPKSEIESLALVKQAIKTEPYEDPTGYRWSIPFEGLPEAIRLAFCNEKWPREVWGPIACSFAYTIRWIDPLTKSELAKPKNQKDFEDQALLGIIFNSQRVFLQPDLWFPFPWHSPELKAFLSRIEPFVPFRFRDQYFKRAIPTKNGDILIRKLPKDWRTQVSS